MKYLKAREIIYKAYKDIEPECLILSLDGYNTLVFEDDTESYINQEQFEQLGELMPYGLVRIILTKPQE